MGAGGFNILSMSQIEQRAAEIRAGWEESELRAIQNPHHALALAMVQRSVLDGGELTRLSEEVRDCEAEAAKALRKLERKLRLFKEKIEEGTPSIQWLFTEGDKKVLLNTSLIAAELEVEPPFLSEVVLRVMDRGLMKWLLKAKDGRCPLCRTARRRHRNKR